MLTTMKRLAAFGDAEEKPLHGDERSFADVDDSSADSFPASDPPAWASLRVGAPSSIIA